MINEHHLNALFCLGELPSRELRPAVYNRPAGLALYR